MQMTCEQLIKETVEYYEKHERAYDDDAERCMYLTNDMCPCAVGRLLKDPANIELTYPSKTIHHIARTVNLEKELKPEYAHFANNVPFLVDLQMLHDGQWYWSESPNPDLLQELSMLGQKKISQMLHQWEGK